MNIKERIPSAATLFLRNILFVGLFASFICNLALAQDLEETIEQLSLDAAAAYIAPVVDGFGADLNAGWFRSAPQPNAQSFNLKIGLVAMGAFLGDEDKVFETSGNYRFNRQQAEELVAGIPNGNLLIDAILAEDFQVNLSGPTAIGNEDDRIRIATEAKVINGVTIPSQVIELDFGGIYEDPPFIPTVAPQLNVGTVFGTELAIRWLPNSTISDEIGELKYFGWGLQHNPGVWLANPLPVDVGVGFYQQNLKIGDIFETTTTAFGFSTSKRFGGAGLGFTPYAGIMFEGSTMEVTYSYLLDDLTNQEIDVNFEVDGENSTRFTVGFSVAVIGLHLNADYNFGQVNNFSAGVMFGL